MATPGATSYQATTAAYTFGVWSWTSTATGSASGNTPGHVPGARGTDAADDQEGAEEYVTHRAARCG